MTEHDLRVKLQNENQLLRLELIVLRDQREAVHDIERLRRENRELREQISAVRLA